MAVFYLLFSFIDLLIMAFGDILDAQSGKLFLCIDGWYNFPLDNGGSVFLLIDGIFLYLFSLMISHIFYKIPDNHGLLVHGIMRKASKTDHLSVAQTFIGKTRGDSKENPNATSGFEDSKKRNNTDNFVD